ncbi:hypothetical protein H8B02_37415 [Bradyrhizobium sp. Pear77]|uniref:thioesterase domain-containing protein n=1 Tax=Bradyrhizobium altum TaxID=1571202 RepID=UPI0028A269DF|nr:thioesterase domain-containing protein [Bradyrhizobium altum]MCC8958893.1 hypothetical protein [Bradyrhizobium altum]
MARSLSSVWLIRDSELIARLNPFFEAVLDCHDSRVWFNATRIEVDEDPEMERLRYGAALVCAGLTVLFASSLLLSSGAQARPGMMVAVRSTESPARLQSSTAHVYLFRGLLNVFSLGMDDLAAQLRAAGVATAVANHTQWKSVADEITAKYRAGQRGPIILVGHSLGADAVMSMAEYLGQMGVPVALVVPFDGTSPHAATANVARVLNLYKNDSVRISRGIGFHGELTNFYVRDANVSHFNIDKSAALHSMVIRKIRAIGAAAARPRGHRSPSNLVLPAARTSTNS